MVKYKLGKVYTFSDREAEKFIGEKGFFSNNLGLINDDKYITEHSTPGILQKVNFDCISYPFNKVDSTCFQFFRPIIEENLTRMTNEELIEWVAKGNGLITIDNECEGDKVWWHPCYAGTFICDLKREVSEKYRIRHFGTDEWLIPTREIFLKDCRNK